MTLEEVTTPAAAAAAEPVAEQIKPSKLQGRALFEYLGSPRTIVAPMVDQSELAWRILSRRYGAELCYSPMYHARLFHQDKKYRDDMLSELDGDPKLDYPLVVQFCGNDPHHVLEAAKLVVDKCVAVDLNLGCPQGIARKGFYGSFLQDRWDIIGDIISTLHRELPIPVTAKIRIFDDKEKTLAYAKHVLASGAQFLTVHGRTREMKGQQTGIADWEIIRYLRDNLPADTVMFANGNILYPEDIERCREATKTDAVMSAEGNLYNPGVFNVDKNHIDDMFPRVDKLLREYYEICQSVPGNASKAAMKSHFFKILRSFLPHAIDIRNQIGSIRKGEMEKYEHIVQLVEERVASIYSAGNPDVVVENGGYKDIPYWRCQPHIREKIAPVNGKRKTEDEESDELPEAKKQQPEPEA